jgi:hypothetical protein
VNDTQRAYVAGLIDGDGSIMLQLRRRKGMKFLFRVKAVVVIYQDSKYSFVLEELRKILSVGYVYERNDGMSELRIEGFSSVEILLKALNPFIRFKKRQVLAMLQALQLLRDHPNSLETFLIICELSDVISDANYSSKNRKNTAEYVRNELSKHNLVPVTTGSPPLAE